MGQASERRSLLTLLQAKRYDRSILYEEEAMKLKGSCYCGAVTFSVASQTPYPYMRCYCSICRKTAGGGGYAINIMGDAPTLRVRGARNVSVYRARLREKGSKRAKLS